MADKETDTLNGRATGATLLGIFRKVALIKACDDGFLAALRSGRIAAPYYSPRGQEVIPSAIAVSLRPDDYWITIYRGLHDQLAKGVPLPELWAEYAGRSEGSCKGKGGPMHISHPDSGVMVTTGIVGSGIPIANGMALASQIDGDGRVTICSFGDGASNIGAFHEGLNLASLWRLPVIFVCQNNLFGEHTAYENSTPIGQISDRAASYGMPGVRIDGNDAEAMWSAARAAIDRARAGNGPTLIEAMTFRFNGHNLGDGGSYIPTQVYESAVKRDPIPRLKRQLIETGAATDAAIARIEEACAREVEDALAYALAGSPAAASDLYEDVYAKAVA